jgi:Tfp pilus assembly protein PilO
MPIDRDQLKVLAVFVVVVGGFGLGIWLPARQERTSLQQRIDKAQGMLAKARQSPSVKSWHQTVASLEKRVAGSTQRVPARNELVQVLRGVSEVLNKRGVVDQQVSTEPAEPFGQFASTRVVVKFKGTFPDAHAVVNRVEGMPRLIQVDQFEVANLSSGGAKPLRVHLELRAFFSQKGQGPPR